MVSASDPLEEAPWVRLRLVNLDPEVSMVAMTADGASAGRS